MPRFKCLGLVLDPTVSFNRRIKNVANNSVENLHNRAGVTKLGNKRKMHVNSFMFRELDRGSNLVEKSQPSIQTCARAAPTFTLTQPNNESYKRGIKYFGAV